MAQGEVVAQQAVQAAVHERPRAHVLGLLLEPDHQRRSFVARQHLGDLRLGPWVELLDTHDRNRELVGVALGHGVVRHLAGRQHHPLHRRRVTGTVDVGGIVEHLLERASREHLDSRARLAGA